MRCGNSDYFPENESDRALDRLLISLHKLKGYLDREAKSEPVRAAAYPQLT
jgi:hypothetical protein